MIKISILIFLIFLDFVTKKWIYYSIDLNNFMPIMKFFDLTHIHNFGISFGFFSNIISSTWLVIIGLALTGFIFLMFYNSKKSFERWGLIFIIIGALSNIFDRALNGYVLDFIYISYKNFYWPAFNFADIYISIGILIILFQLFRDWYRSIKLK